MAPELKSKKRKAAQPDDEIEKVKKVKQMASEVLPKKRRSAEDGVLAPKKSKVLKDGPVEATKAAPAKKSALKKKALAEVVEDSLTEKPKSSKDVSDIEKKVKALKDEKITAGKMLGSSRTKSLKPSEADEVTIEKQVNEEYSDGSEDEEIDDQTEALLKGFESDEEEEGTGEDYVAGQEIPALDKRTKKKLAKAASLAAKQEANDGPGVVYLGRVPHGFYENEMKQYFSQFGDISRIRLSRNRKTGQSKHFAFIEFKSADVANIVSKTMDNYLLFKHILKCKVVPKEQVHEELFKGANKRFKKVPWNKMEGRKLQQGATEAQWQRRIDREQEKREKKAEKMKELGYEFDSPKIKSAKDLPKQKRQALVVTTEADVSDEQPKAIEAPLAIDSPKDFASKKKQKKDRKSSEGTTETVEVLKVVKAAKTSKRKAAETTGDAAVENEVAPEISLKKTKKVKKVKAVE